MGQRHAGHDITVILAGLLTFFALGFGAGREFEHARAKVEYPAPSPRSQALACWHEFQSGRRATTADCPEL